MRRIGNLLEETASIDNIEAAVRDSLRHRGKRNALSSDAGKFMDAYDDNVLALHNDLLTGRVGEFKYRSFERVEHGKVRRIDWNPSFRDNVVQHALFNTAGRRLVRTFIPDTYSGIEGRGSSYGRKRICQFIQSFGRGAELYALKGDIRHYYQSIDTGLLCSMLEARVKDEGVLELLLQIVRSHSDGLPIGNYLSQLFANLYLSGFDHWVNERLGLRTYARYWDDLVAFGEGRRTPAEQLCAMRSYLRGMGLALKHDAQVFPIGRGGLDFMGFVFHRGGVVRLRKRIERAFRRAVLKFTAWPCEKTYQSLASYNGWTKALTRGRSLWDAVAGYDIGACLGMARAA